MAKLLTEFIGTCFFILVILMSRDPIAIGGTLMVMVYMGGHVSGGHYNPAVTLGFVLRGRMKPDVAIGYWAAQFAGAITGALLSWACMRKIIDVQPSDPFLPSFLVEALFTFALCMVVFNTADTEATKGNSYYGLAIGFTITAAAYSGGKVSGGAFNPAVGLGPDIVSLIFGKAPKPIVWLLYTAGPAAGAIGASIVYKIQHAGTATASEEG
jgi:aquaporin Z